MDTHNPRPNPYVGPRSFQRGEKMYGRDREIRQLADLLVAERIVMMHSPSGAGKTSLIHAGLLPRLEEEGFHILPIVRVNQDLPEATDESTNTNRYVYSVLLSLEEGAAEGQQLSSQELLDLSLKDYLSQRTDRRLAEQSSDGFGYREEVQQDEVLIFDQFEEILTTSPTDQAGKEAFFEQLGEALRDRQRWALFSIREDYMAALAPYLRPVPTRLRTTFRLDLLGVSAALQAIQQPPLNQQVTFDSAAARRLVNDLRKVQVQRPDGSIEELPGPYVEPVQMQVVCYRLWQHLSADDQTITEEDLENVGDVNESLAEYYSERVVAVAAETGVRERTIREWFERELITDQGIRSQVIMGQGSSGGLSNQAIALLEDAHVVRAEKRRGVIWYELAHDRLVGPVRSSNITWFQKNLSLLQRQAGLWQEQNRPERLLLRGEALDEAEQWAIDNEADLTDVERDFLEACRLARQRELEERERQEQAVKLEEQARLADKLRRRFIIAALAAVVALLFFGAAAYFAYDANIQRTLADSNAATANAASTQAIANEALANAASTQAVEQQQKAEAASTQAIQEQQVAQTAEAEAIDARATSDANALIAEQNAQEAQAQARLAQSRQLASQSQSYLETQRSLSSLLSVEADNQARTNEALSALLTNIQVGLGEEFIDLSASLPKRNNGIFSVAISPDNQHMAWGLSEGTVEIWDLNTSTVQSSERRHEDKVFAMTFSPDGRYLVSGGNQGAVVFSNMQTGESFPMELSKFTLYPIFGISYNPEGTKLAINWQANIVIYDVTDPQNAVLEREMEGGLYGIVQSLAWGPDNLIASGGREGQVLVWDPQSGEVVRTLTENGHTGEVRGVAWSPNGRLLASTGFDGQVILWDIETGTQAAPPLESDFGDFFYGVTFSSDNRFLAAVSGNGTLFIWNVTNLDNIELYQRIPAHDQPGQAVAFSPVPGVNLLTSGGLGGTLSLHQINLRDPLSEPVGEKRLEGDVRAVHVLENQSWLIASFVPSGVLVYEYSPQSTITRFNRPGQFASAAFSPDGSQLLLGGQDGSVTLLETAGSGQVLHSQTAFSSPVTSVAFLPDENVIAAGTGTVLGPQQATLTEEQQGSIRVINIQTGDELISITTGVLVSALGYDDLSGRLISGDELGNIRFWNLDTGKAEGVPLARSLAPVVSLSTNLEQGFLASGSQDNTLSLWDLATGQVLGPALIGASGEPYGLAFTPLGDNLYSGDSDGNLLRWDTAPESWKERVCAQAGRNLTEDEWNQFMPEGMPYQETCPQFATSN